MQHRRTIERTVDRSYLYAYTLARMRPPQVAGIAERKLRELVVPALPIDADSWYERKIPAQLRLDPTPLRSNTTVVRDALDRETKRTYREHARAAGDGRVTFMNRTLDVASNDSVDWYADALDDVPRLWRLKLYAFEPLAWVLFGYDTPPEEIRARFEAWIDDWRSTIEIGGPHYLRRAWTPYAVSLRVLNWSRYLACREREGDATAFDTALAREIYKNTSFLMNHIESDVGGNHLVENGAGLVAAGTLFGDVGERWVEAGVSVLEDAARNQFLSDGCHFERSPMYHVQVLTRYLTARDLLRRAERPVPDAIERTASAGVAFAESIAPPDGELPLLNDSVHGQTLPLQACLEYARATGVNPDVAAATETASELTSATGSRVTDRSGLGWLDTDVGRMLIDGGPVGPPHLPGHAHSDTLSYLLWLGDTPVVTDTGTFDYEAGTRRDFARGVRGHNTVQVDTDEPIELGGRFLMGPRPVPTVRWDQEGTVAFFEGCYEARPRRRPRYVHHRSIAAGDHWWLVWDRVAGDEETVSRTRSRLHLHPAIAATPADDGAIRLARKGEEADENLARVHAVGTARLTVEESQYFPQFGVEVDRQTVVVETTDPPGPNGFGYVVTTDQVESPSVVADARARAQRLVYNRENIALSSPQIPLTEE